MLVLLHIVRVQRCPHEQPLEPIYNSGKGAPLRPSCCHSEGYRDTEGNESPERVVLLRASDKVLSTTDTVSHKAEPFEYLIVKVIVRFKGIGEVRDTAVEVVQREVLRFKFGDPNY